MRALIKGAVVRVLRSGVHRAVISGEPLSKAVLSGAARVPSWGQAACGGGLQQALPFARGWASLADAALWTAATKRAAKACSSSGASSQQALGGGALRRAAWTQAARQAQQARGFSRYLQFQPRGGGSGWRGPDWSVQHVIWGLIAANCGVFLLWRSDPRFCWQNFAVSIDSLRQGRIWTAATAAFSHRDFAHLAANMIGLYFFGRDVGQLFGGRKLLALYLLGGVAGSLAHCGWYFYQSCKHNQGRWGRSSFFSFTPPALGASAAVNATMVVDILLFPTRTILLYGIIPMPAALLGILWLMRDVTGTMEGQGHIAHAGHLGGAICGLAFFALFKMGRIRPRGWH